MSSGMRAKPSDSLFSARNVVQFSTGIGSAEVLRRIVEEHGTQRATWQPRSAAADSAMRREHENPIAPEGLSLESWVLSDSHFGHENIAQHVGRPQDHDELMRQRWIETVGEDDVVLHLGDLVWRTKYERLLDGLPGRKYLLLGNHDHQTLTQYARLGFEVLNRKPKRKPLFWHNPENGKLVCFSHEPVGWTDGWSYNVHGHIHTNGYGHGTLRLPDRINVSIEKLDYQPIRIRQALNDLTLRGGWPE